jgi:hypothetical protein
MVKTYEGTVTDGLGVHEYTVDIDTDLISDEKMLTNIHWKTTQPEQVDVAEDLITMQVERILL